MQIETVFSNQTIDTFKIGHEEIMFLKENINNSNYDMKQLYKASKDGFHWKDFHKKVDNKGPTLTLIKSEYD